MNDYENIIGSLVVKDQNGNIINDKALKEAALLVYNEAGEMLINDLLIPCLNDIVYEGISPRYDECEDLYQHHGEEAFAAAYKFLAYCGYGKVGSKLIYPSEVPLIYEGVSGPGIIVMPCIVEDLWVREGA